VNVPASVEGDARLRLFCALTLAEDVLDRVVEWQSELAGGPFRLVPRDNLHITLVFLGNRSSLDLPKVIDALEEAVPAAREFGVPYRFSLRRYYETPRVGFLDLDSTGAPGIFQFLRIALEERGVEVRDRRVWRPHISVLRFRERPRLKPPLPELGRFSPSEAAVYHSVLRPTGAQYVVLHSLALGG